MNAPISPGGDGFARIVFQPSGKRGRFAVGTPVLDAARALGVYVESVCGGRGICGRCQIDIAEGRFAKENILSDTSHLTEEGDSERKYRLLRGLNSGRRLSCQARILDDIVIEVPVDSQSNRQVVRKRAERLSVTPDSPITMLPVNLEEPDMARPRGDCDRLLEKLRDIGNFDRLEVDFFLLGDIQKILRKANWQVTAVIWRDGDETPRLVALWPQQKTRQLGLAVDIGSTTIAAHLCDLSKGRTIASHGTANPQIRYGEDLMSRVSYLQLNPDRRVEVTQTVRKAINALISKLVEDVDAEHDDIVDCVIVGNPVMHHLFLGIDPVELGGAPFALARSDALNVPARELELDVNRGARIYMLPCIAGHVGADAAAVLLSSGAYKDDAITLVVDIGTNAEIMLGNRHRLLAASSPTGPAFEGAEISSGQRAAPGAIERVRIDRETLEPRFKVVGIDVWSDEPSFADQIDQVGVTGICGSGLIETIGEMYLSQIILRDGMINGALSQRSSRIVPDGRVFRYILANSSVEISITQQDIRAVQLAKAALYAGIKLLQDKIEGAAIERIFLAGAFGNYIDPLYAMAIGLIPDCDLSQVKGVGNAAGTGARLALFSRPHRRLIEQLVHDVEKIETALEPRFQEHFVAAMGFPHDSDPFANLATQISLPPVSAAPIVKGRRRATR